jgi:hypothetical protein
VDRPDRNPDDFEFISDLSLEQPGTVHGDDRHAVSVAAQRCCLAEHALVIRAGITNEHPDVGVSRTYELLLRSVVGRGLARLEWEGLRGFDRRQFRRLNHSSFTRVHRDRFGRIGGEDWRRFGGDRFSGLQTY